MADAGRAPDTSNWNPVFAQRLAAFRDALEKAGIHSSIASGYRTPEYQNQMYQNHLAKQAKQPLPYPNVEAPDVVAAPWRSFHNYGIAADLHLDNPNDYARMAEMARQFGLSGIGPSDPGHIQLAGTLADDIKQYHLEGWRPESRPAPETGAIAFTGGPPTGQPPQTILNRGTGTVSPSGGSSFIGALGQIESNNRNIYSEVDKDYPGQPNSRSQGYYQIDTPTWLQFAAKNGIDTNKYPNAMSAPQDVQAQVASSIPLSRFGARTQRMLSQQFGNLDAHATIGQLAGGTTLTSTPQGVVDPSIVARGGTSPAIPDASAPAAPSFGEAIKSGDVGGALKAALTKPPPSKDAQGNDVQGKSPLQKLASTVGDVAQKQPTEIPAMPQAMPAQDPDPGLAPAAQQLFQTVAANAAKPLSWTSTPYGANAGLIRPGGTTLNQTGYGYNG